MISEAYRAEQERLHENPGYGVASVSYAPMVTHLINELQITEVLDYGCGKGRLGESIQPKGPLMFYQYDPAIPDVAQAPEPAQMVCCIDVLEHIEPEHLDSVLDDLQKLTQEVGFFTIHTGPAKKVLSDGRNAHLIQETYDWWLPKLMARFHIHSFAHDQHGFYVVCRSLTTLS